MRLQQYLNNEALKISQIKEIKDDILSKKYKNYMNNIFKDKDRIYIPLNRISIKQKIPSKIKNFVKSKKLEIIDYKMGIVKNKDSNRILKLGKILNKNKEQKLLQIFNNDKSRQVGKISDLIIVISRHPYDIAGMSTNRGWTSCMSMDDKDEDSYKYVNKDIKHGTIIAYIIKSTDKNINKPIGRLLLKPFINIKNPKDIILYPENMVYGTNVKGFRETIIKWLKTFQTFKGNYKINPELYRDTDMPMFIGQGDKYNKNTDIRYAYYKKNPQDKDAKNDTDNIRYLYYENNPQDKDAKNDTYWMIRALYFVNNPYDKDAKYSDSWRVRQIYYKNYPEDEDFKDDPEKEIRNM